MGTETTAGEPGPPREIESRAYSFPVAGAASNCPNCERPFRFEMRAHKQELNGRLMRCPSCGTVLGRYVVRVAGMLWLELACRVAIDTPRVG